jgi:hypothetical protein
MPSDLNRFQYVVLPSKFCHEEYLPLYDRAYHFWKDNWNRVFADLKADKTVDPDDFFRQDFIPLVVCGEDIVAIHLYTLYDFRTDAVFEHSYLSHNFDSTFVDECRKKGLFKMMSMESIFANPAYRKSKTGVNWPLMMAALGQKIFLEKTDAQSIFAPARVDIKVSESVRPLGFEILRPNVMLNNVPVDFIICRRENVKPAPDADRFLVQKLWASRTYAGEFDAKKSAARAA